MIKTNLAQTNFTPMILQSKITDQFPLILTTTNDINKLQAQFKKNANNG